MLDLGGSRPLGPEGTPAVLLCGVPLGLAGDALDRAIASLTVAERETVVRFRRREDRLRALTARRLARHVLAARYGCAEEARVFERTGRGRPFVAVPAGVMGGST